MSRAHPVQILRYVDRKLLLLSSFHPNSHPDDAGCSHYFKFSSSYGFKCACVADALRLRKSSSRVKQEASLLIWASWLISLVLIYRRRLGVIRSLVFPSPTLNGTSDKRPPTHSSWRSVITFVLRHREVSALISFKMALLSHIPCSRNILNTVIVSTRWDLPSHFHTTFVSYSERAPLKLWRFCTWLRCWKSVRCF